MVIPIAPLWVLPSLPPATIAPPPLQLERWTGPSVPGADEWAAAEDGHLVADPTGVIVWANTALLAHFGYGEADLEGENLRLLMPSAGARRWTSRASVALPLHPTGGVGLQIH